VCTYVRDATSYLGRIAPSSLDVDEIETSYTEIGGISAFGSRVVFVGASPTEFQSIVAVDPATGAHEIVRRSREDDVDPAYISFPEAIDYNSSGRTAHAFFYAPRNEDFEASGGSKPPLLVFSHGGPTGNVTSALNLTIQFWTSRGFAVVDVNYGGSTGYGRDYRRLLNGNWGLVDVEDSVNAALYLVARGDVDGDRLAIRGGSAGGFTTLAALVFSDVFKAGANYFGVSDFTPFVEDTHKFESRYLDSLVGPYPEKKDLYYERSPANFVERISAPVITFQGTEDKIVPPSQSERIVDALRANKIPCAYVTYEGEQHGFRHAKNIVHSLESELYFYGRVFGFEPADAIEPVEIEGL
jgi:dipeptidyl aminopeptidase/acylaminoacyl peptidase